MPYPPGLHTLLTAVFAGFAPLRTGTMEMGRATTRSREAAEYKPNKAPFCWLLPAPHRRRYLPAAFTAAH